MALFKRNRSQSTEVVEHEESAAEKPTPDPMPDPPAVGENGLRDFWQHWDYLLTMVPELAEFGVPVLDAVGLTLNEAILAESDLGGDIHAGDIAIDKGARVITRMLPLLTGMGIDKVMARPNPRVLVIALSTAAVPASYLVAAQVRQAGGQVHRMEYVFDQTAPMIAAINEQLVRADFIITIGGLGESGPDLRTVVDQIGPNDFTPVAVSPGRDHGFALAEDRVPVLALPADAYATFVLTKLLVEPMIAKLMGAGTDPELFSAYLAQPLRVTPGVLTCVPATVTNARMTVAGRPAGLGGLYSIYHANALAILANDDGLVAADSEAFYLPLS
ncbi:MAG: hypothetical protein LBV00_01485 [Propionibacteriaceae bacterium]|jgi:molybdopterin molybdotransferase|nr:hypothetical protein [Propionibacteriaceae bacterium]